LGAKIDQEGGRHAGRTAGYSNDHDALRWEFGIDLEPEVSESAQGSPADPVDALGALVKSALSGELAHTQEQGGESE